MGASSVTLGSAIALLVLFTAPAECYRLLIVFPMVAPSHYNLGSGLAKGLAEAGHDVTIIAPFREKTIPKEWKYREIYLSGFSEERDKQQMNMFDFGSAPAVVTLYMMNWIGNEVTEKTFEHPNVQKLLQNKSEKFDAVIVEQFMNDAMKVFSYHYNAPLILFSTVGPNAWVNPLVANPAPPSHVPDIFLSFSPYMTFFQRVQNNLFTVLSELNRHLLFFPAQNRLVQKYFPGAPDLSVLNYNSSLILLNSHVSVNSPAPLVPSMINIGGFHVKPAKTLPKDLKDFIEGAKDGVVYFSMGSNLKSKDMPKEKIKNLLNVFRKLKQKVIWKFEDDSLPDKPDNLKISKWLPQNDILGHPNVKVFITHGGLLSTTETVYHGVPVLAIPIFGDQKMNVAQMLLNGYGLSLDFDDLYDESKISSTLNELLTNPKYRENAKKRSRIMHDQPMKPMEAADFWIQYVIRHNGATHLRTAGLSLTWYQYIGLDVWAFIVGVSLISLIISIQLLKIMCGRNKQDKTDIKKKKN